MNDWRVRVCVFLVAVNLLVVCGFWGTLSGGMVLEPQTSGDPAIALGRLAGLLLQFALLLQLILIGRIAFIERALGFARLNQLHRWLGYSLASLLVLHPLLLTWGYASINDQTAPAAFIGLAIGFDDVLQAILGFLLLLAVIAASIPWVRRKLRYESWHFIHLATYVALWLSFGHQVESGGDFSNRALYTYWYALNGGVVGIYFVYRFVRPFAVWYRHRFVVSRVVQESPDVWSVYITGRNMKSFRFESGQFATLHLLTRGLWAGHPFSFSQEYDGSTLRFSIKALGDGTALIARLTPGVRVLIDGPLGAFTSQKARTDKFLLIGGGIGITPLRAIAGSLAPKGADIVVLYGARTKEHMALLEELSGKVSSTHVFLSQEEGALPPGAVRGQIDTSAIRTLVPDVAQRDVYVCGPTPMMDALIKSLREIGVPSAQIHSERFAF
jgi:predicted ferric reductase